MIGPKLRDLAKIKGISQSALAKEAGISRVAISRFLNGHSELKATDFMVVLKLMGIADIHKLVESLFKNEIKTAIQEQPTLSEGQNDGHNS